LPVDLAGLRVAISAGAGGIGRVMADAFAACGARLFVCDVDAEALAACPHPATRADMGEAAEAEGFVDAAVAHLGGLDVLVNNAGIGSWGHFSTSSEEIARRVMEVNFFGPVELTRAALPHLENGNQPCVVNVTSMCGRKGMPAWPEYSASKFALVGMSEAWRGEFERFGVETLTIVPGMTDSGFDKNWIRVDGKADLRFADGMKPEEVAAGIVAAIRSNRTETVLGSEARRLLRFNRYFPRLTNWLIARKVKKLYVAGSPA
jgi:NAD(P)-dependent dehydrogenase (short-subunit alcohol dehydrogenase family)